MPRSLTAPVLELPDLITRAELNNAGVSDDRIARLVAAGLYVRVAPSMYVRRTKASDRERLTAAAAQIGPAHAVTGPAGLRALGMRGAPHDATLHVLVPHRRQPVATPPLRFLRTVRRPETWSGGDGLRIAVAERCAVDAARLAGDLRSARAVLTAAACWGVDAQSLADEAANVPRRGSSVVRRAVSDVLAGARSAPEAELGDVLCAAVRRAMLPRFLLNPQVLLDGRLVGSPDAWIVGAGVGVQVDSREFHEGDEAFDATLARHDTYAAAGLTLLHVTPRRLRRLGDAYAKIVLDAVGSRRRSGAREPAGLEVLPCGPLLPVVP